MNEYDDEIQEQTDRHVQIVQQALENTFSETQRRPQPRVVRRWRYWDYIIVELKGIVAHMFDVKPILGNLVVIALLVGSILAYRLNAGIFPEIGRWEPWLLGAFAAVAAYQLFRASLRSYLAPVIAAAVAAVGLAATQGDSIFMSFATPVYQWVALSALISVLAAALSGRE
jgi:hypothetical protein